MSPLNNETLLYLSASAAPSNFGVTVYNGLFAELGINAVYLPRRVTSAAPLIEAIRSLGVSGCSVSMPLKSAVLPLLDEIDELARLTGSVNTIVNRSGRLLGYNTDVFGVYRSLLEASAGVAAPQVAVIFGTGSVVRSIVLALKQLGANRIYLAGRRPEQALSVAMELGVESAAAPPRSDLLVNATPASKLAADEAPELYRLASCADVVFDLVVSPMPTPLLSRAKNEGKPVINGLTMAVHQFIKQFEHYFGDAPPEERVRAQVEAYLRVYGK